MSDDVVARLAQLESMVGELGTKVVRLEGENEVLRRRLDDRPPSVDGPKVADVEASGSERERAGFGRRRLLVGGATAVAVAAAGVVATATPAAAAGDPVLLGAANAATAPTEINATGSDGLHVTSDTLVAIQGTGPNGVVGSSTEGIGVVGSTNSGTGVWASSADGVGLFVHGPTNLRLDTYFGRPAPTGDGGFHNAGEVVLDNPGNNVWLCVSSGSPGTWRKVSGPAAAGAFHVLPIPARIYDSRAGTAPSQGPKTKLSGNVARTIDCTVNSSGVPIGATAVALTVLLLDAANANGNMTIWANGAARPAANTMVWGAGSGRYTSSTISAVDAGAKIQVSAGVATNVALDVVGYYR